MEISEEKLLRLIDHRLAENYCKEFKFQLDTGHNVGHLCLYVAVDTSAGSSRETINLIVKIEDIYRNEKLFAVSLPLWYIENIKNLNDPVPIHKME